ncbi:MAG: hypothetical protein A2V90_00590, partial [Gammaproteobacteria bacterium RBG_16_57_12]
MKTQRYDLIIVGGGMVGATLACALGDSPLRIALVEHQSPSTRWPVPDFDIRVSAITRATENVFRAVGAWPGMEQRRVCPYQHMRVWDAGGNGEIHFDCAGIGEANLGHIIENSVIQAALWERAGQFGNIARICPATPAQLAWDNRQASLMLSQGITLASSLLVGADGGRSWVREQGGIDCLGWDYQQTAVVATIKTPAGHQDTAWQRFLPDGPLAFLPLPGAYCSIVWSTRPAHAETLLALSDADFLHTLQQNIGDVLGELEGVGPRGAFQLRLSHTREYVRPRLALIGDAAHSIHPLAGQGVNLGVADAASL